jgi:hypothetical protein
MLLVAGVATDMKITEDEFEAKYKPRTNHLDDDAGFNGWLYETFGDEVSFVVNSIREKNNDNHVWTVIDIDCDGELITVPGYRHVNRVGHILTEVPWESDEIEVKYDDGEAQRDDEACCICPP